ncbi:MAG: nucleoside hydrolase [Bacillota bacterium]
MIKKQIILDCDPGHDDAVAIMLAGNHPNINLLGITVESGNQTLEKTGKNALYLCEYLSLDVPVYLGSDRPLIRDVEVCEAIHGTSGLDGVSFPPLKRRFEEKHAVDYIIDTLRTSKEKITIVTTGPMTNLALAIRLAPDILTQVEAVILMGGSIGSGNVSPAAEFNILSDPEAAHIVFTSGLKVVMIGLDVTRQVLVTQDIVHRMDKLNTKASDLFVKLMNVFNENQRKVFGFDGGPLHDPVTIAYLIEPKILELAHVHCDIDISHGTSYGRTNCDLFGYLCLPKNTFVAKAINKKQFWDLIETSLKSYPKN